MNAMKAMASVIAVKAQNNKWINVWLYCKCDNQLKLNNEHNYKIKCELM